MTLLNDTQILEGWAGVGEKNREKITNLVMTLSEADI